LCRRQRAWVCSKISLLPTFPSHSTKLTPTSRCKGSCHVQRVKRTAACSLAMLARSKHETASSNGGQMRSCSSWRSLLCCARGAGVSVHSTAIPDSGKGNYLRHIIDDRTSHERSIRIPHEQQGVHRKPLSPNVGFCQQPLANLGQVALVRRTWSKPTSEKGTAHAKKTFDASMGQYSPRPGHLYIRCYHSTRPRPES
jgi:hypothetical protein